MHSVSFLLCQYLSTYCHTQSFFGERYEKQNMNNKIQNNRTQTHLNFSQFTSSAPAVAFGLNT
ncbi:hypothetical protein Fmac_027429 [Flemingia macrophylla]|uniref:Uncharacterized protein n=1 Tax=Flemingia macrophylla TaxID=520843 RepID=A0ABD1LHN3_9FABA